MLGFLPSPIGDELLYSMLARHRRWSAGTTSLPVLQAAFGEGATCIRVGLPGDLEAFAASLPSPGAITADQIIAHHTLFPYFSRILGGTAQNRLLAGMRQGRRRGGYEGLGVFRGATHWHRCLNLCPNCSADDLRMHGEAAWHRVHQLPGVFVCPEHCVPLRASPVSVVNQAELVACPTDPFDYPEIKIRLDPDVALRLARASRWLLLNSGVAPAPCTLQAAVRTLLGECDWLRANGMVRDGLREAVVARFGRENLASIGVEIGKKPAATDMQRLWGRSPSVRALPLTLLLLLDYLNADVAGFFRACEVNGAAQQPGERRARQHPRQSTITRHRSAIRELVRNHPQAGRTLLRQLASVPYCHLLQHDRAWLESVLPLPRKPRAAFNLTARDRELAKRVQAAITRLRKPQVRPRRLTLSRIAAEAGARTVICREIGRLPQVGKLVNSAVETLEQFRRRCLVSSATRFRGDDQVPTWSAFVVHAGLKPEHGPELEGFARQLHRELLANRFGVGRQPVHADISEAV